MDYRKKFRSGVENIFIFICLLKTRVRALPIELTQHPKNIFKLVEKNSVTFKCVEYI